MTKQIPLSGQNGEGKFAIVDDGDFDAVSVYSWYLQRGYAVTRKLRLHHFIIGNPPAGLVVDHIDGNPLNNQRANLRWATVAQNVQNAASQRGVTSRFKGVHRRSSRRIWEAVINSNNNQQHLGSFMSEFDAARAYNAAAIKRYGEFARLNVIPDDAEDTVHYRQAIPDVRSRTSQYRGVSFYPPKTRWAAAIGVNRKVIHLGYFDIEEEAARAYDAAAKLHHGDRAFLNFPVFEME